MGDYSFPILLALMLLGTVSLLAIPREKKRKETKLDGDVGVDQYAEMVKLVMNGDVRRALKKLRHYGGKETDLERRRLLRRIEEELRKYA